MHSSSLDARPLDLFTSSCAPLLPDWLHDSTTTSVVERVTGESMSEPPPHTAAAALAARGFALPEPERVDAFSLFVVLDELVAELRELGIVLEHTHHLPQTELYARLHLRLTVEQLRLPPRGQQTTVDLLDIHRSDELRAYGLGAE